MYNLKELFDLLKVCKNYKRDFIVKDGILIAAYDKNDDEDEFGFSVIIDHGYENIQLPDNLCFNAKELYTFINLFIKEIEGDRKADKIKPKEVSYLYTITDNIIHVKAEYLNELYGNVYKREILYDDRYKAEDFCKTSYAILQDPYVVSYDLSQETIDYIISEAGMYEPFIVDFKDYEVAIPLLSSIFKRKKYSTSEITLRATTIDKIYQLNLYLTKGKVRETLSGFNTNMIEK